MAENWNSNYIGKQIKDLNIWIKEVHTQIKPSMQYQSAYLTACKTYFKDGEKRQNKNRQNTPSTGQFIDQIWLSSKNISKSKINLDEIGPFKFYQWQKAV